MTRPEPPLRTALIGAFSAVEPAVLAIRHGFVRGEATISTAAAFGLARLVNGLIVAHVLTPPAGNGFLVTEVPRR